MVAGQAQGLAGAREGAQLGPIFGGLRSGSARSFGPSVRARSGRQSEGAYGRRPTRSHHAKIQVSAVFPNIAPADLAAFKQVAAEALELTIPEPGTLHYDWFFSEDETKCVVREIYADSDAMLAHLGNVGELLGRLIELGGGLEPEGFGSPSAALAEAIAPFSPTMYGHFQGK